MAIYLLDGVMCPAFYLTGSPRRAAYIYDTPEGQNDLQIKVSNSLVFVPDDNGNSWTAANAPTGANMVLAAPDNLDTAGLQAVYDRLVRAKANQERALGERLGGATHGEGDYDPSTPFAQKKWQKLGYPSKQAWIDAGRPEE